MRRLYEQMGSLRFYIMAFHTTVILKGLLRLGGNLFLQFREVGDLAQQVDTSVSQLGRGLTGIGKGHALDFWLRGDPVAVGTAVGSKDGF